MKDKTAKEVKKCTMTLSRMEEMIANFEAVHDAEVELKREANGKWSMDIYSDNEHCPDGGIDDATVEELGEHVKETCTTPKVLTIEVPFAAAEFLATGSSVARSTGKASPVVKACREAVNKYAALK